MEQRALVVSTAADAQLVTQFQNPSALLRLDRPEELALYHGRFSFLGEVIVSRYGIVGVAILDSRPEQRMWAYDGGDHYMDISEQDLKQQPAFCFLPPHRLLHFKDTAKGFSVLRCFVHPDPVRRVFEEERYEFLGPPMIEQCHSARSFIPKEMDEIDAYRCVSPMSLAMPLLDTITARLSSEFPGLFPNWDAREYPAYYCKLSFHPWMQLAEISDRVIASIPAALDNIDELIDRAGGAELQVRNENALPSPDVELLQ